MKTCIAYNVSWIPFTCTFTRNIAVRTLALCTFHLHFHKEFSRTRALCTYTCRRRSLRYTFAPSFPYFALTLSCALQRPLISMQLPVSTVVRTLLCSHVFAVVSYIIETRDHQGLTLLRFLLLLLYRLCVPDAHYANLLRLIVVDNARFTYPRFHLP